MSDNGKPKNVVVGLRTLDARAAVVSPRAVSVRARSQKARVFTDDQWRLLQTLPTETLKRRILRGRLLINILYRPEMINMTPAQADFISSNLRFQIDAIQSIIDARGEAQSEDGASAPQVLRPGEG